MKNCNHPLINKYIEKFSHQNQECMVTEFASHGNLRNLIDQKENLT
jgi:hypothetical protein